MGFLSDLGDDIGILTGWDATKALLRGNISEAFDLAIFAPFEWTCDVIVDIFSSLGWVGVVILAVICIVLSIFFPPVAAFFALIWDMVCIALSAVWGAIVWAAQAIWAVIVYVWEALVWLVGWIWDGLVAAWEWLGGTDFLSSAWDAIKWLGSALYEGVSALLGWALNNPLLAAGLLGAAAFWDDLPKYALIAGAAFVGYKFLTKPTVQRINVQGALQ